MLKLARYMREKSIHMKDLQIFKVVDANYNRFVGKDKNILVDLILHHANFDKNNQGWCRALIKTLKQKHEIAI